MWSWVNTHTKASLCGTLFTPPKKTATLCQCRGILQFHGCTTIPTTSTAAGSHNLCYLHGPAVDETTRKCGHVFCESCIKTAISIQVKCPTCRRKVVGGY